MALPRTSPATTDQPTTPAIEQTAQPLPVAARSYRREIVATASAAVVGGFIIVSFLSAGRAPAPAAGGPAAGALAAAGPSAAPPVEAAPTQKWTSENSAYWVGNARKSKAFELPAERTVQVWTRSVRPTLLVRCIQGNLQVLVITESALKIEAQTSDHTVTYSFDGGAAASEAWPDSEEHDALFVRDSQSFVDRLLAARTLQVGYTPHNASPVVASFHVAGLAPLFDPFARECGRK